MDDDKDDDATDLKLISSYLRSEALADGVLAWDARGERAEEAHHEPTVTKPRDRKRS